MKIPKLLIILLTLHEITNAQLDSIIPKLKDYNRKILNEQVYIQTDRDVYYPGDTIWYKAYIRGKMFLNESNLSQELNLRLVNKRGTILDKNKLLIINSQSNGQLIVDDKTEEGFYYLVANTSWMENFEVDKAYVKKILIRDNLSTNYHMVPLYSKSAYFPGDTVKIKMMCYDNFNRQISGYNFKYSISTGEKPLNKKAVNNEEITFVLDNAIKDIPKCELKGSYKGYLLDTLFEIPTNLQMDVSFFPEGGYCINGLMGQIAFKATYANGKPAVISGSIVDVSGKKNFDVTTIHDGMGSFLFVPQKDTKFFFQPDGLNNSDKQFELPKGHDNGWQLKTIPQNGNRIITEIIKTSGEPEIALLTLRIRDYVCYYNIFQISQSKVLSIFTDSLPSGVGVITIFNQQMIPQAERLVFINYKKDNKIDLFTDKANYSPRDSTVVHLKIIGPDSIPVFGQFSISIFDKELG